MPHRQISHAAYMLANFSFLSGIVTSLVAHLPVFLEGMAAIAGTAWSVLMIWESDTVQKKILKRSKTDD